MYKKTFWGFAFLALVIGFAIWLLSATGLQYGIDLQGGTELTYRLDLSRIEGDRTKVAEQVKNIISKRLNAYGLKEISVSVQGEDQIVVQLPGTDAQSVTELKRQVETAGRLEFRLVATEMDQTPEQQKEYERQELKYDEDVRAWIEGGQVGPRPPAPAFIVRPFVTKEDPDDPRSPFVATGVKYTLENNPDLVMSGSQLTRVGRTVDQSFQPAVHFEFGGQAALKFGEITGNHVGRDLTILLDDDIIQKAVIRDRISGSGQISGGFSDNDVQGIVNILRGGSLPTKPELLSEVTVGSVVGQDSIRSSLYAIVSALAIVMGIMTVYYLFAGLVANFALALNVFMILAYVSCFRQTLTLPGIAGILLTVGMAVDANILIFERVREEKARGKSLLQSLATGYRRAFWVIFDANLTTLITGFVLFNFGTGPVKGFAVTLISGIFISFITAIYVTRLVISFGCNIGLVKEFRMFQAFATPSIGFVSKQRAFLATTTAIIAVTWILVVARGKTNYGIDFTGGARINMQLRSPVAIQDMKDKIKALAEREPDLFEDWTLQTLSSAGGEAKSYSLRTRDVGAKAKVASAQEKADAGAAPAPAEPPVPSGADPATPAPADAPAPAAPAVGEEEAEQKGSAQLVRDLLEEMLRQEDLLLPEFLPVIDWRAGTGIGEEGKVALTLEANFIDVAAGLTTDGLKEKINAAFAADELLGGPDEGEEAPVGDYNGIRVETVELVQQPVGEHGVARYKFVTNAYSPPGRGSTIGDIPSRNQVLEAFRKFFHDYGPRSTALGHDKLFDLSEPFSEVATVGPRVATGLQLDALVALFIPMLGIIFYVSLRFEFTFGVAAIAALIHDVLITIGVVAVTDFFFSETFPIKINLAELAALLTIVGYSINDTIVVFDRIRENMQVLAKKRLPFTEIVDLGINQTLSRTLWTSLTTLVVTLVLLFFATESVRGFAFIFMIGVITGTYSSVFVASPVLIWLQQRAAARREAQAAA